MNKVIVYSTPYCGYCMRAKVLLKSLDIPFEDIDVGADHELREQLSAKYKWQTVPMIMIGEKFIGGYDDLAELAESGKIEKLLS